MLATFILALASSRVERPVDDGDTDLVAAARAGDRKAFTRLYRRHLDPVYGRLTRLIGPVPEREDLLQQIFLDVHRALPSFRGDAAFTTFLHRIVVNVAYDFLSARRRRRSEPLDGAGLEAMCAPGASPEAQVRQREEIVRALQVLSELKPKKRIAFVLVAVEGLSLDAAAALVGAEVQAVKQRVLAARREIVLLLAKREARR